MDMNPIGFNAAANVDLSYQDHHGKKDKKHREEHQDASPCDSVNVQGDYRQRDVEKRRENAPVEPQSPETGVEEVSSGPREEREAQGAAGTPENSSSGTTKTITIISTNDLHGYFKGMPQLSAVVHELKSAHPDALMVDVGDTVYNPSYSDRNHFEPMVDIMNHIGYTVVGLGNHELQWGAPAMNKEYVNKIDADVVNANLRDLKTGDFLPDVKPYVIKEVDGVKIGFVGTVVPDMATSAHPNVGKDVKRLDIEKTVEEMIPLMKKDGAEVIVVLSHHGIHKGADLDLAKNVKGIDVIFSAHDHQLTEEGIEVGTFPSKTYVFQGMSHAKYVGETTIEVDARTHKVIEVTMKAIPTRTYAVKPDPVVEEIIKNYEPKGGRRE
jgi:2',3'-cyclic-nucleotide 2'-phosphodiesterase (5'-nucleotidase family)